MNRRRGDCEPKSVQALRSPQHLASNLPSCICRILTRSATRSFLLMPKEKLKPAHASEVPFSEYIRGRLTGHLISIPDIRFCRAQWRCSLPSLTEIILLCVLTRWVYSVILQSSIALAGSHSSTIKYSNSTRPHTLVRPRSSCVMNFFHPIFLPTKHLMHCHAWV